MPEITFHIQWPNGQTDVCYSPSLIVREYFETGQTYTIHDFLTRSRESLQIASDRVQAKYGFPCSRALGQLKQIEMMAQQFMDKPDGQVIVQGFEPDIR